MPIKRIRRSFDWMLSWPLARQELERLPQRRSRDAERLPELALVHPRTGRERALDDHIADAADQLVVESPADDRRNVLVGLRPLQLCCGAIIGPVIIAVCVIGAYKVANATFDLWIRLIFGVGGYVFKKLDYPIAPLVLAIVLGDKAEDAFRQSMIMSRGSLANFWSNPLAGSLTILALVLALWPLLAMVAARASGAPSIRST